MATISRERIVYLGDEPCGLDFSNVAISGGNVVMGVWGRDAETGEPTADAEAAAGGFDPAAIVARVDACHPNVKAYAKDDVPDRYKYKENVRIAPVIIAADVGWTLCGYESWAGEGDGPGGGARNASDPLNWAATHGACRETQCGVDSGVDECGTHGYDNAAREMRALFMARGPAFRSDGVRLVFGGDGGENAAAPPSWALPDAADADASTFDAADASRWEKRTYAFDNVDVHDIVMRAMGMRTAPGSVLADGAPPPATDAALSEALAAALFVPSMLVPDEKGAFYFHAGSHATAVS
jgi:ectonucleotide pyrophosphatase/phosphodiesterase family protein 4